MFIMAAGCSYVIFNQTSTTWEPCNGLNLWCTASRKSNCCAGQISPKKIGTDLAMSKLAPPPKMGISLGKNFLRWITLLIFGFRPFSSQSKPAGTRCMRQMPITGKIQEGLGSAMALAAVAKNIDIVIYSLLYLSISLFIYLRKYMFNYQFIFIYLYIYIYMRWPSPPTFFAAAELRGKVRGPSTSSRKARKLNGCAARFWSISLNRMFVCLVWVCLHLYMI